MKRKTLQKTLLAATIFSAAMNFNACAYGPPSSEVYSDSVSQQSSVAQPEEISQEEPVEKEVEFLRPIASQNQTDSKEYDSMFVALQNEDRTCLVYLNEDTVILDAEGNPLELADLHDGLLLKILVSGEEVAEKSKILTRDVVRGENVETDYSYQRCVSVQVVGTVGDGE